MNANVAIFCQNEAGIDNVIATPIASKLQSGDTIDIPCATVADLPTFVKLANKAHSALSQVKICCHTAGIANVSAILNDSTFPGFVDYILDDYEAGRPDFTRGVAGTLFIAGEFQTIVQQFHKTGIFYPSGSELGSSFPYGALAAVGGLLWIQTQVHAAAGLDDWKKAINDYIDEFHADKVPIGNLGVQFTYTANLPKHQVTVAESEVEWDFADSQGIVQVMLWDASVPNDIAEFLDWLRP